MAHTVQISGYSIFSSANIPNNGGIYVALKPFEQRKGRHADDDPARPERQVRRPSAAGTATAFGAPPILGLGNAGGFKMQIQDKGNLGPETLEGMTWNLAGEASKNPEPRASRRRSARSGRTTRSCS